MISDITMIWTKRMLMMKSYYLTDQNYNDVPIFLTSVLFTLKRETSPPFLESVERRNWGTPEQ